MNSCHMFNTNMTWHRSLRLMLRNNKYVLLRTATPSVLSLRATVGGMAIYYKTIIILLFVFFFLHTHNCFATPTEIYAFTNKTQEEQFHQLTTELRCLVCQNQSLADSYAPLAGDLRLQVAKLIQSGKNNAEIKHYLTVRYGDYVLYRPPVELSTWFLWFSPMLLLALSFCIVIRQLRRRTKKEI